MSAARRNTGAALAALCLFDGDQRLVRNIQPAVARGDGLDHLEGTFEARLRGLAGASGDVSCLVAVHEVVVDGLIVGHVGIADPARESWSVADLRSLAEIAAVVSTHIEARDARVEVARSRELVTAHNRVHDMIVRGVPLREVLTEICQAIELYDPSLVPSVLQRDPDSNTLHGGVGPQFPQAYHDAIEGAPIGPSIGTCGPAAWFARLTVSENLAEDPNWGPSAGWRRRSAWRTAGPCRPRTPPVRCWARWRSTAARRAVRSRSISPCLRTGPGSLARLSSGLETWSGSLTTRATTR
jgi:hypothetical protein